MSVWGGQVKHYAGSVAGVTEQYIIVTKYKTQIKDLEAKQESVWQVPRQQWKSKKSITLIC